jgi:hypothetical protein
MTAIVTICKRCGREFAPDRVTILAGTWHLAPVPELPAHTASPAAGPTQPLRRVRPAASHAWPLALPQLSWSLDAMNNRHATNGRYRGRTTSEPLPAPARVARLVRGLR